MTEKIILSEIYQLPENLKLEVLHFIIFLKSEYAKKYQMQTHKKRVFGRTKGKYTLAPDFDAPIVAQAICKNMNLISKDEIINSYLADKPVKRIW